MVKYSVGLDGLETLIEAIQEASSGIAAELARLDVQVSALEAAWSGEARDAYSRSQAESSAALAEMNDLLARIVSRTQEIAARYATARRKVASTWGAQ